MSNEPKSAANYIETVYGTRTFARALDLNDADSIMDLMDALSDYNVKMAEDKLRVEITELNNHIISLNEDLESA